MAQRPASLARVDSPVIATYALIGAQVVAWLVVRQYLLADRGWTELALRPGAPTQFGLIVSPFIHLHPAHLGVNLAVLWLVGANLERAIGAVRFLGLYLGAAWFASLMHWAVLQCFHLELDLSTRDAAVGSSGAVAGILGACLVRFPMARLRLPLVPRITFSATPVLVLWSLYTLVRAIFTTMYGISEGVGHWAHVAGFIFGLGGAQVLLLHRVARQEYLDRAARQALARENFTVAVQAWSALLALRPEDLHVRHALVRARLALGDAPGAQRLAREGIEALVKANRREVSLEAYRLFLGLVPELALGPGVRYRLGCWLIEVGDAELAFRSLWESVREDGASAGAASALYRAGQVAWERLKDPAHAREAWEYLLERFPDSAWSDAARDGLRGLPAAS